MIDIVGSTYHYQGEQLFAPEIIIVRDHHYNEDDQCFHLHKLLKNSICDSHTHTVIFDHVLQHDDILKDYQLISFPSFLARENTEFIQQQIQPDWSNKIVTFNFMINKPRPHRTMLLNLIEEFELTDYCHALPWKVNTINNIPVTDYRFGSEVALDQGVRNGNFRNAQTYQRLLQKTVFEPSCVSLITEPAFYEQETIVTEKTLMAMYAGTIPIWVGGWGIPDYLKTAGFDIFDDIVDHSYQWLEDPKDRCRHAIKLNQDLLCYFDLTKHVHWQCQERLRKNVELLESNFFLGVCQEKINQHTGKIQEILIKMLTDQVDNV